MARKIELSDAAFADIADIADYGGREFGLLAAEEYRSALEEKLRLITAFPEIGPSDPTDAKGTRGLTAMSHRIIYRVEADHIVILRILHVRQLPPGLD
jgi:toxin ParE1/3/4